MRGQKRDARDRTRALSIVAATGNASEAARQTGVPVSTVLDWTHDEEFVKLRERTKDEVTAEWWAFVQSAFRRAADLLAQTEDPVKAATTGAIMFDKIALSRGEATTRTESRDLNGSLDDHELATLKAIVQGGHPADDPAEAPVAHRPGTNGAAPS